MRSNSLLGGGKKARPEPPHPVGQEQKVISKKTEGKKGRVTVTTLLEFSRGVFFDSALTACWGEGKEELK